MGRNLGFVVREELANLEKDPETQKAAMSNLRSIAKDLDVKLIDVFVSQVSETNEIGSESGGYTVSLFEDLTRAHGVEIAPHVEKIMPVIIRSLSSSEGSLNVQQACSKAVSAMARYGIDPSAPEDKRRNVIHALCKPLSDSLLDTQHHQHLALGSALCLKPLVDCGNWRSASDEMVNSVCQSLAVALEATSSEATAHMALVMSLAKHNPFVVEAYARLLVKSGLRIMELGAVEGDSQKQVLAIQMVNFLMKNLNPKSLCSELEVIMKEMEKHQRDQVHHVKMAACEAMRAAERLKREADQETEFVVVNPRDGIQGPSCSSIGDEKSELARLHQRNISSDYNKSLGSRTNRSRSSRRSTKKRHSQEISLEHGFKQDSFSELLENRQQLQQSNEYLTSSSSSSIHDASGTTTPTNTMEDVCEKPKLDLDVEAKVEARESHIDHTGQVKSKNKSNSKCVLGLVWSLFFVAVACLIWMQLGDETSMHPHLVPT